MIESDRIKRTEGTADSQPGSEDRSPPELDEAILKASRRAVHFQWLSDLLKKFHLPPDNNWQLLIALAIGLVVGLGVESLLGERPEPAPAIIYAGDPPLSLDPGPDRAGATSPESWLESIAVLLRHGRVSEAEVQLSAFRERYPEYGKTTKQ